VIVVELIDFDRWGWKLNNKTDEFIFIISMPLLKMECRSLNDE
jgi:hypothetical protein